MVHFVIHAGMPKAASTTIQRTLAHNRETLAAGGVLYPETPAGDAAHRALHAELAGILSPGAADPWRALAGELERSECRSVILSCEDFFFLNVSEIARFAGIVKGIDPSARVSIVIVMRRQDAWLESWYNQSVKAKLIRYPGGILDLLDTWQYMPGILRYAERLSDWRTAFAAADIQVLDLAGTGGRVVDRVCAAAGLDGIRLEAPSNLAGNVSLSLESLAILRRLNAEGLHDEPRRLIHNAMVRADRGRRESGEDIAARLLPDDVRARILDDAATGNVELATRFAPRETEFFAQPAPSAGTMDEIAARPLSPSPIEVASAQISRSRDRAGTESAAAHDAALRALGTSGIAAIAEGCGPLLRSGGTE